MLSRDSNNERPLARPPVEPLVFRPEAHQTAGATATELWSLAKTLKFSSSQTPIVALSALMVVILLVNLVGQLALNRWLGEFYRAIENKNMPQIWHELARFLGLVIVLLAVVVSQTWVHERLKIRIRGWLTHDLLDNWLVHGRPYGLSISSEEDLKPDQRIQEDARNLSEMSADLGMGMVQSSLLLVSFVGILWSMSEHVRFAYSGNSFAVPGYMVWVAILYALAGASLTAKIGRPLIYLNELRYDREAHLRFSLMRVSESAESIAFSAGEDGERQIINQNLSEVLGVMLRVSSALARLTWITSGYGWIMIVLPILVALPGYIQGAIDLGGLMMVVGAFNQVQQSLRWFVDNFPKIADWRATLHRVVVFRDAVTMLNEYENQTEQIQLADHPEGYLSFDSIKISLIDGEVVIADATAQILPGERVLIEGESGSGKSTLFRALSGMWPWGSGVIRLPPREQMMFLPQRSYLPLGSLAAALCYPNPEMEFERSALEHALRRVNLEEFIPMLDRVERWDKTMSLGQQQRFAFARVLLHKPKWVFLDEATSALDDQNQETVMSLFTKELRGTTILSIGHRPGLGDYHTRSLQLRTSAAGTILRRRQRLASDLMPWTKAVEIFTRKSPKV